MHQRKIVPDELRYDLEKHVSAYLETHYVWISAVGIENDILDEKKPVAN